MLVIPNLSLHSFPTKVRCCDFLILVGHIIIYLCRDALFREEELDTCDLVLYRGCLVSLDWVLLEWIYTMGSCSRASAAESGTRFNRA